MDRLRHYKKSAVLYVLIFVFINFLLLKYLYNLIFDKNSIVNYSYNIFILLNYIYFIIKIYIIVVEPESFEYEKKISSKNEDQITRISQQEVENIRNEMKTNFGFVLKYFLTMDLLNTIFCFIMKKITEDTIVYIKILYVFNLLCSLAIYWKIWRYYSLKEIENDIEKMFSAQVVTI